jgi:FkbM family methyltransferase
MKSILPSIQQILAKSKFCLVGLIKMRNQIDCVLGYDLAATCDSHVNGEENVTRHLHPFIKTFFDVGANRGAWADCTNQLCGVKAKGYLFEPDPKNYDRLKSRFRANRNVQVIKKALGREPRKAYFLASSENDEHSAISILRQKKQKIPVCEVATVDGEMRRLKVSRLSYLKIDTEGFDSLVIQGAEKALRAGKIDYLQFEYNSMWKEKGSTLTFTLEFLASLGYKTFLIRPNGIQKADSHKIQEVFRYSNFLAVKKSRLRTISTILIL